MRIKNSGNYQIFISEKIDGNARCFDDFFVCKQTHGNEILVIDDKDEISEERKEADGIITNRKNTKIGVLTADCNGIVLMGKNYFAVIHAGWKGLQNNIIGKGIAILREKGETDIQVFVGPSIRSCCYEVGEEFLTYFDSKYLHKRDSKIYLDMVSILHDIFTQHGITKENIQIHSSCTKCDPNFFSHRSQDLDQRMVIGVEIIK